MTVRTTLCFLFIALMCGAVACAAGLGIHAYNLPPAHRLMHPGPGVAGPGPGVLSPAVHSIPSGPVVHGMPSPQQSVQILFNQPDGLQIRWDVSGVAQFDSDPLIVPGRKNFPEGGIYRLKLTNIPGRVGIELYPSLEVGPTTPRTAAYLAHNAVPVQLTEEDFDQVLSGNFVTKVIYLPDPEFQQMALAGVETLVSTRLDPGMDPIVEADRRGSIMAVVRLGNKDIEMPGAGPTTDQVMRASFSNNFSTPAPVMGSNLGPTGVTPAYVSGITTPHWGMPSVGTPIGLPGPPHIPFGAPAGFQQMTIHNRTPMHIPGPVERFHITVRQQPGFSYPKPPTRMHIREQNIHPSLPFNQPHANRTQVIPMPPTGAAGPGFGGFPVLGLDGRLRHVQLEKKE